MPDAKDLGVECRVLYQQTQAVLTGIENMAREFSDRGTWVREIEALEAMRSLRSDLSQLTRRFDEVKASALRRAQYSVGSNPEASTPLLVGGIAAGLLLGKLMGSKSQLDLLPFLLGLELASDLTRS